jgi:molybdate transport system permease protein
MGRLNNFRKQHRPANLNSLAFRNGVFWSITVGFAAVYLILILAMLTADFQFTRLSDLVKLLSDGRVRYSLSLSLISSTISATLAVWFAIPSGYWLARFHSNNRPSKIRWLIQNSIVVVLDIPIVLPPIVVGISLLILFQTPLGSALNNAIALVLQSVGFTGIHGVTYEIPAIILAQFTVVTAFAIRTMRACFEQIDDRPEKIALTLGASDYQVFAKVAFPQSIGGIAAAFTLAWARAIGEFGPILIFAGTTRMKTEVMPTTIYLSFQSGDLGSAVSASVILVSIAVLVLLLVRFTTVGRSIQ